MRGLTRSLTARVLSSAAVLAFAAPGAWADEAVTLKYRWEQGEVQRTRLTTDTSTESKSPTGTVAMRQRQIIDSTTTAKSVDAEGTATLEVVFDRIRMDSETGETKESFDSRTPGDGPQRPQAKVLTRLAGARMTMVMASTGEVKEVRGIEDLFDDLGPMAAPLKQSFGPEGMKRMLHGAAAFPTEPVRPGERWERGSSIELPMLGRRDYATEYTFVGLEGKTGSPIARISLTTSTKAGDAEGEGARPMSLPGMDIQMKDETRTGDLWFDPARGRLVRMVTRQTMKTDMTTSILGKSQTTSMSTVSTSTTELLEDEERPEAGRK